VAKSLLDLVELKLNQLGARITLPMVLDEDLEGLLLLALGNKPSGGLGAEENEAQLVRGWSDL
jgi:hypothetical protein